MCEGASLREVGGELESEAWAISLEGGKVMEAW